MIDADIYGWAVQRADGDLSSDLADRLRDSAQRLAVALPGFPAEARPYYRELLEIAMRALAEHSAQIEPRTVTWAELVEQGVGPGEWTELAWAVENLEVDEVRRLLEAGADPNETFQHGTPVLHWALDAEGVIKSYDIDDFGCEITKLLIAHGADVTATDEKGRTPLERSRMYVDTGAEAALLEAIRAREQN
jgi:hypothetical protein